MGAQIAIFLACVAGAKRGGEGEGGGGEGEKRKRGEKERELTLFPQPLSLLPFQATIFSAGKARAEKSVCSPQATGWGIQEEVCCDWLNTFNKSV